MSVDPALLKAWVKGWALAKSVSAPTQYGEGFRVDVDWPEQKVRYVFPAITDHFCQLLQSITEPWHYLKVCAPPSDLLGLLPPNWKLMPLRYLMCLDTRMKDSRKPLPSRYSLEVSVEGPVFITKVIFNKEETAAIGRAVFAEGYCIYDRIETNPSHQRLGLATTIMKTLESIALEHKIEKSILVATEQGKQLYETLGWKLTSLYSTAVIPAG